MFTGLVLTIWAAWRATTRPVERDGPSRLRDRGSALRCLGDRRSLGHEHRSQPHALRSPSSTSSSRSSRGRSTPHSPASPCVVAALGPWLDGLARAVVLVLGAAAIVVSVVAVAPDPVTALPGAWRLRDRRVRPGRLPLVALDRGTPRRGRSPGLAHTRDRLLVAIPVAFVAAMAIANAQPIRDWSRSLDAFRAEVDRTQGVADAIDVLPANRRDVLWGWTAASLSLVVRSRAGRRSPRRPRPGLRALPRGGCESADRGRLRVEPVVAAQRC